MSRLYENGRFLSGWRKKDNGKNKLSPDETAMLLRERQLDMMNYGVINANTEIPNREDSKAVMLPHLLGYSPAVQRHFDMLRGILHAPSKFQITTDTKALSDDTVVGDVLYEPEEKNHVYYIGNRVTSPFTNPFVTATGDSPVLLVSIMQDNSRRNGMWDVTYDFFPHNPTSNDNISSSFLFPERDMVLTFWYSPKQLSGTYIFDHIGGAPISKKRTSYIGEEKREGFRRLNYHFDASATADQLETRHLKSIYHDEKVATLRQKGDVYFSVVEVGTVNLGGEKHWIYTGSENAQVFAKKPMRARLGVLNPRLA